MGSEGMRPWPAAARVVVYASSPVQKVIGEFEIESILEHPPEELWNRTREGAGISKDYFMAYFGTKDVGYASASRPPSATASPGP